MQSSAACEASQGTRSCKHGVTGHDADIYHVWHNCHIPCPLCRVYPGLLETVACGHIVTGFQQCQPQYVRMAVGILRHLPFTPATLEDQAVAQLLLGQVAASTQLLKEAERMAAK